MTLDEAKKVAAIVATAEGGCGGCCEQATAELNKQFPEFKWTLVEVPGFDHSIDVEYPKIILDLKGAKEPTKFGNCGVLTQAWQNWKKVNP